MKRAGPKIAALTAACLAAAALAAPAAQAAFGLNGFDVAFTDADGNAQLQAGSHPYETQVSFNVNSSGGFVDQNPRDVIAAQVPGLVGNPTAVPPCATVDFLTRTTNAHGDFVPACPNSAAVGIVEAQLGNASGGGAPINESAFNLEPPPGKAAKLGFWVAGVPVTIELGVNESPPYNVVGGPTNISEVLEVLATKLTLWGVPADPRHDPLRGLCLEGDGTSSGNCPANVSEKPFLTLPRACHGPLLSSYMATSWQGGTDTGSALTHDEAGNPRGMVGCGRLSFGPTISAAPTTHAAQSASGLAFDLDVKDEGLENPAEGALAASDIERTVVTLPEGMTINPSQAEGLEVCTEAQLSRESATSAPGEGCPQASKVGTIEVETPLLEGKLLKGQLFVAEPYANLAGDSLIAVYVVIREPQLGIFVRQPIRVEPDPRTGQLIATTEDMPQLPFSHFRLRFREGGRAPLISPPGCGSFEAKALLYPYSGAAPVTSTSTFTILSGPGEGPCPSGAPFAPGFEAGTIDNAAGSFSPFAMRLTRKDAEQDMGRFSFVLPPGVVPKLAGIPYCPEAAIAQAQSRTGPRGGTEELERPSCPAASQIGRTVAGAGVGSQLTYVSGSLYLAGPYHGDPISAVAITPAVAGPFDAGVVVVREALRLNPATYVGEVDGAASDPIPHILKGIPLNLRDLRVYADRPGFTLNATNCEPFQALATVWGDGTALAPAAQTPVGLASRYQAAGCARLGLKPKLGLKLKGGTRRGKFPRLRAVYTPRAGDANLKRLALTFPRSEFIEQGHFRTICTRVQFAAGAGFGSACPQGSIYGHVRAWSPLLAEPLEGPVYLRSSNHNLPDAVLALHGIVDIEVAVRIDSVHGRLRATVQNAPDAPVSRAIIDMQGGQKGLFVNSTNICKEKHRARANVSGQNGRRRTLRPVVRAVKCKRGAKGKKGKGRGRR